MKILTNQRNIVIWPMRMHTQTFKNFGLSIFETSFQNWRITAFPSLCRHTSVKCTFSVNSPHLKSLTITRQKSSLIIRCPVHNTIAKPGVGISSHNVRWGSVDRKAEHDDGPVEGVFWMIRLANENSYLSWCRNAYIAVIIGVTVMVQASLPIPFSQEVSFVFFVLGLLNMVAGTGIFCYNTLFHRDKFLYTKPGAVVFGIFAVFHLLLFLMGSFVYLGLLSDEDKEFILSNKDDDPDSKR